MAYPVQNLIEGCSEPTWVLPTDPAAKALALMTEHDYSQLPVVDEARRLLGGNEIVRNLLEPAYLVNNLSLPLNIQGNSHHPFCKTLKSIRKKKARMDAL